MTGNAAAWTRGAVVALSLLGFACGRPSSPPRSAGSAGPATRIVALSPHLTELAFAAGAGGKLVGVVEFSNHPAEARTIPRIGDAFRVDLEALSDAQPDLVLGWPSGNSPAVLERLQRLGYRVVALEPRRLADIADHIETIGRLAGTEAVADEAARTWRNGLTELASRYGSARVGRVFYQISPQPLITANNEHFIGQAIEICGGTNLYGDVPGLTPVVSMESVIADAPDAIVASDYTPGPTGMPAGSPLDAWRPWTGMPAVANNRLYLVDPDLVTVPGPRLLGGIAKLCAVLNGVEDP